jgi:hypothetical protein
MIEKEFIPYELALELKQIGFNEPCLATIDQTDFIHINGTEYPIRGAMIYDTVDCPTYSQAFRWFREKHGLAHQFQYYHIPKWTFQVLEFTDIKITPNILVSETNKILTYEEAELECLKKLIEIVK